MLVILNIATILDELYLNYSIVNLGLLKDSQRISGV